MAKNDNPKASEAAKKAADDAGLDLGAVKPTGKDDTVTKEDVATAQEEQEQSEQKLIYVKLNPDLRAGGVRGSDGVYRHEGDPETLKTTEANYDNVLSKDVDREGNRLFRKGGTV